MGGRQNSTRVDLPLHISFFSTFQWENLINGGRVDIPHPNPRIVERRTKFSNNHYYSYLLVYGLIFNERFSLSIFTCIWPGLQDSISNIGIRNDEVSSFICSYIVARWDMKTPVVLKTPVRVDSMDKRKDAFVYYAKCEIHTKIHAKSVGLTENFRLIKKF